MQIHSLLQGITNAMPLKENIDDNESIASKDYETNDNDVRKPAITLLLRAKSQVVFFREEAIK